MAKSEEIKQLENDYWIFKKSRKSKVYQSLIDNNGYTEKRLKGEYMDKFSENSANDLTKAIIALFYVCGGSAWRINTMGIKDPKTGKYRRSGASLGVSDIIGCINGALYAVEVKLGKDRQSTNQSKFQKQVENAKGVYLIARSLKDVDRVIRPVSKLTKTFDLIPSKND